METDWEPSDSEPDSQAVVHNHALEEEALEATEHEVVEPLLGSVGTMMPDVAASVGRLLVEVLLAVPGTILHLWHTETLTVSQSHVLSVTSLIMSQSTSYTHNQNTTKMKSLLKYIVFTYL